jgi:serine/threonine protein kinase
MGNYHNSSNEGNYSYDYKGSKYKYSNMHGKSVTANTSPVASTGRHPNKKHMQNLKKNEIGFSQSQQCSPSLSKSHKLYNSKGKANTQMSTAYALAQIGKKTYAIPTNLSKSIEQSTKLSSKGSTYKGNTYKGNTAYYDVLGYNQYNMLMTKKNKKKDSFHHNNTKKDLNDTINIKAMEYQGLNKESPLGLCDENELKYYMQQNKIMKGMNMDNLILDGGTGGGNSKRVNNYIKSKSSKRGNGDSGKLKSKPSSIYNKKPSKKNATNTKINKYFGGSRKNSKYKPIDMANLIKLENNKQKSLAKQKKYSPHPNELRRKTNSVEPPSGLRMVSSPGAANGPIKYHRHNKSVNQPNSKNKTKHYVMSQGNSELKQTLENAKRKGNALRSLHRSDLNSLDQDDSSEYDIQKDGEHPGMISKEVKIPSDLYASYKRQKLIFSALDTPISHLSKDTSPQFIAQNKSKIRASSMIGASTKPGSAKDKKRASSSNAAQHRQYMMNSSNNSNTSHDQAAQIEQYSAQKYYDMYNQNHNKSAHTSAPKYFNNNYSNHNWEIAAGYPKNAGLKVIEEIANSKKQLTNSKKYIHVRSNESSQSNFQMRRSSDKNIKINGKKGKPREIEVDGDHPMPDVMGKSKKNEYASKLRDYEHPTKKERKSKSNTKEAYSQNSNYNDHMANKNGSLLEYNKVVNNEGEKKSKHRKVESKIEHYLDKLEENSVVENLEEIKHSDLLEYIDPVLFNTMDKNDFEALSPRSKEINSSIRIVHKSFRDYSEPPETTTDFYKIGRMLGKGAFGKVNLGMHKLARKLVAIKSMNKQYLNDERSKKKVMQEVNIIKRTRHPNVVKLYETFESNKHVLFSMEMCAGGDLLNYVRKRRKLKENVAKVLFKQIIEATGYIHTRNIVHRDIKLDNILLDGKGNVKIGDFGVSRIVKNGEVMKEQCGTPAYIAPEILEDKGYTGYGVDIWSAGVVLYSMLYGSVPFKANNMEELHTMIMKGKYTLKEDISDEARDLLKIMLEKSPRKRATVQEILKHDWFKDIDKTLSIFNEQEIAQIRKEFTYNEARRIQRKDDELEAADCFTELAIDTTDNTDLKNVSSKSIILAPFNSTKSHVSELHDSITDNMHPKNLVIKFEAKCRDVDRQYEMNN